MEIILKYFPDLTPAQKRQFAQLDQLYRFWNEKINVISRKDIEHLFERHVLHSLALAKVISFQPKTNILDVGTGGGFPGIPLAILFPECKFHLVDSIGKKINVVKEITRETGLQNLTAEQERAEKLTSKFDFIVSRAVTTMPLFIKWVQNKINKDSRNTFRNGILALKGGNLDPEIKSLRKYSEVYPISNFFEEEFFDTKKVVYIRI